jgi:hypothetical protein
LTKIVVKSFEIALKISLNIPAPPPPPPPLPLPGIHMADFLMVIKKKMKGFLLVQI